MTTEERFAPWSRLPRQLATAMAPQVGRMRAEILRLIDAERGWSERVTNPKVRADLVAVTGTLVTRFVELIGTSAPSFTGPDRALFRELGAGEAREGRGLEDLLAAYRIGTRVLYTRFATVLTDIDPSPRAQVALGEAVFALIDALQAESADGYAHEVATHTGERERRLRRLTEALLSGDEDATRSVAPQVGWPVPGSVAVVLLPVELISEARSLLAAQGVVVEREGTAMAVLAADHGLGDVPERLAALAARAALAAPRVGPTVPLLEARRSWLTVQLLEEARGDGPAWAVDRLPTLLTRGAPDVATTLRDRRLAPLAALRPSQRDRLTATLAAWLRHWGQRAEIAAELSIHPQTVAYRVNQLRELFGDDLDDPRWRLEMQLALL